MSGLGRYQPTKDRPHTVTVEGVPCRAVQWWRDGWVSFATVIAPVEGAMFIASWFQGPAHPAQDFHSETEVARIRAHLRRVSRRRDD